METWKHFWKIDVSLKMSWTFACKRLYICIKQITASDRAQANMNKQEIYNEIVFFKSKSYTELNEFAESEN